MEKYCTAPMVVYPKIGDGAICKVDVLAAAKSGNVRPNNSIAFRNMARQNEQLLRQNAYLSRKQAWTDKLILNIYAKMGEEIPGEFPKDPEDQQFIFAQGTYSSHAGGGSDGNSGRGVDGNSGDGDIGGGGSGGCTTSSNASE
ncbi:hypothetical protein ACP70R_034484 [Stipagrostis hirtigluma subsp. patula]